MIDKVNMTALTLIRVAERGTNIKNYGTDMKYFLKEVNNMFLLLALLLVASGTTFMTLYGKAKTHREQSVYMVMAIWQLLTAGITMDKFFN
jgi:hypothetical protein